MSPIARRGLLLAAIGALLWLLWQRRCCGCCGTAA